LSTALVTGSHGFVGRHLRQVLRDRGWDVVGLGRVDRTAEAAADGERYIRADLADTAALTSALDEVTPSVVFHLAASPASKQADGATATEMVAGTVAGTCSLMSASAVASTARPLVILAGSAAQYGLLPIEENPITEESRCNPVTPYGWAKAAAEATARAFSGSASLPIIPVRVFNMVGPGEPPATVASALAARVLAVVAGQFEKVHVRDLSAVRDFTDVRDIAAGFVDLAERGTPGRVYNLCSGRPTTVGDILDGLLAAAGLDRDVVHVLPNSGGCGNVPYQVGSNARVAAEVGWSATIDLFTSLRALLTCQQQVLRRQ
jgi:GDP-4-dehydro-6-deoxy-D-mannose reductase